MRRDHGPAVRARATASATSCSTSAALVAGARSTSRAPPANVISTRRAASSANCVLPTPPGPTSVTSRSAPSRDISPARSLSRPTRSTSRAGMRQRRWSSGVFCRRGRGRPGRAFNRGDESIALARKRLDEPRRVRTVAEHLPNLANAVVETEFGVHVQVVAPDVPSEIFARDDRGRAGDEHSSTRNGCGWILRRTPCLVSARRAGSSTQSLKRSVPERSGSPSPDIPGILRLIIADEEEFIRPLMAFAVGPGISSPPSDARDVLRKRRMSMRRRLSLAGAIAACAAVPIAVTARGAQSSAPSGWAVCVCIGPE